MNANKVHVSSQKHSIIIHSNQICITPQREKNNRNLGLLSLKKYSLHIFISHVFKTPK